MRISANVNIFFLNALPTEVLRQVFTLSQFPGTRQKLASTFQFADCTHYASPIPDTSLLLENKVTGG